jgi:hypothetical protein
MYLSRRLLYASEIWEVARPRTVLTAGHVLIRLSNPAIAFDLRSAADWLLCHNAARLALADVLGARRCTVLFAHQWHPIGAAIGEPEVESSTPTFHLFGRWDGETVTPGEQLLLPTQRRVPVALDELLAYDDGLRTALRRSAAGRLPEPDPCSGDALPEITAGNPGAKAGRHHTVLSPVSGPPASDDAPLTLGQLLALAASVQELSERPGVTGLSCVVPDPGAGRLEIHALGRSAGEATNPLQDFLSLPSVNRALL